jgi:hypothetical protein
VKRRDLLKAGLALGGAMAAGSRPRAAGPATPTDTAPARAVRRSAQAFDPEYIVVGSGAGGGTVAARLAERGFRVLVLEAGGDPRSATDTAGEARDRLPDDYDGPPSIPMPPSTSAGISGCATTATTAGSVAIKYGT